MFTTVGKGGSPTFVSTLSGRVNCCPLDGNNVNKKLANDGFGSGDGGRRIYTRGKADSQKVEQEEPGLTGAFELS